VIRDFVRLLSELTLFLGLTGCSRVSSSAARAGLAVIQRVEHIDALAKEPMIAELPDGSLFVAGYGEPGPKLWKSIDQGRTWARVNVGTEADGAIGNSDVDLAVAPDGTLYFVTMGYDRVKNEGTHVAIGVSGDAGASWNWSMLSKTRFDDRPWVKVAPDGSAHVIWNDGNVVSHAISRDRGTSWTKDARIHTHGGSSHLAIGPHGEIAVRVSPASASGFKFEKELDLIAVSTDAGATWVERSVPGHRTWNAESDRWVEPLAWGSDGSLYHLWAEGTAVWLARSADLGAHWRTWRVATGSDTAYFPFLAARGHGELAATWHSGARSALRWHAARISVSADGAQTRVDQSLPLPLEFFAPDSAGLPQPIPAGEYIPIAWLRDGSIASATSIRNLPQQRIGFTWWRFAVP
jgi:hypothetical protein